MTKDTQLCNKQKTRQPAATLCRPISEEAVYPVVKKPFIRRIGVHKMLWIIFLGILTLWLLFVITSWTFGGFMNVLLLFAVAAFAFQVLTHRDTPA